jgi:hypothetical protein
MEANTVNQIKRLKLSDELSEHQRILDMLPPKIRPTIDEYAVTTVFDSRFPIGSRE